MISSFRCQLFGGTPSPSTRADGISTGVLTVRHLRFSLALFVLLLSSTVTSAQPGEVIVHGGVDESSSAVSVLGPAAFRTLSGNGCAVRYSQSLDRAHHVLTRLETATWYFNDWSEFPVPSAVYIMTRDEWERAGVPTPYGLPVRTGPTALLAPAEGDGGTVRLWAEWLGREGLPKIGGQPLIGTRSEASSLLAADTMLQVEAARSFVARQRLRGRESWIGELAAHVAAGVVSMRHEKSRLNDIDALFNRLATRLEKDAAAPVEGYSPVLPFQGKEGVARWLWYQARFHEGAELVLNKDGKDAVQRLLKLSRKSGALRATDLLARYPALEGWLASFATMSAPAELPPAQLQP